MDLGRKGVKGFSAAKQGDQMILLKYRTKSSPTHRLPKTISVKCFAQFCYFKICM
jgi:hypothetical protein